MVGTRDPATRVVVSKVLELAASLDRDDHMRKRDIKYGAVVLHVPGAFRAAAHEVLGLLVDGGIAWITAVLVGVRDVIPIHPLPHHADELLLVQRRLLMLHVVDQLQHIVLHIARGERQQRVLQLHTTHLALARDLSEKLPKLLLRFRVALGLLRVHCARMQSAALRCNGQSAVAAVVSFRVPRFSENRVLSLIPFF